LSYGFTYFKVMLSVFKQVYSGVNNSGLMGIDCEENIHIPTQLPFSNVDISILLGNSIDNAIEAAGKVKKGKNVKIYMVYDKNILLITITNPFVGTLIKDSQGVIKTTKKDKDNHGFGLESIRRVVEKYHGSVVIEDTDNQFVLKVMLVNL
uniref:ATP-binding protein n=1 Tax=Mediterraneibacter agrestimuris TaxID=2941333 RepID=UPI0020404553